MHHNIIMSTAISFSDIIQDAADDDDDASEDNNPKLGRSVIAVFVGGTA